MNESETNHQASSRNDIAIASDAGSVLQPSRNVNPQSTNKIKKARSTPKPAEFVIFSAVVLAFLVLLSWQRCRAFLDNHAGSVTAVATISIVILTMFYVIYARSQWEVMEGQLEQMASAANQTERLITETKKTADAAFVSAQAVMHSERARIVCSFVTSGKMGQLIIRNCGRTPAFLIDVKFKREFPPALPGPHLPDVPDYGEPTEFMHKRILCAGDKWEPMDYRVRVSMTELTQQLCEEVENSRKRFYVYGRVEYRDVFAENELHETRFCYWYSPRLEEFIIGGPPEYTKYT